MAEPTSNRPDIVNVAYHLRRMARIQPHKRAVIQPVGKDHAGRVAYSHMTFQQFDRESDRIALGLNRVGIKRGTRTILMVQPSLEFFALTFAIFKTGAVPVVVDPGMGIRRMVNCLKESHPTAFIGIPKAHVLRKIYPNFFKSVKTWITVGRRWFWGGHTLAEIKHQPDDRYEIVKTLRDEMAAILFTTGSTGPAKGTIYTHGNFDAQISLIKTHFGISTDEIDLPTFPLFALFDPALGMTAVIPDMDPTKPAQVDPLKIIEAIYNQGVTNMFASPALLHRVGSYGKNNGIKLPSLKRIISAGAPIQPSNIAQFSTMLEGDAQVHTGYGATEAMPVAAITGSEILNDTRSQTENGAGVCVGRPIGSVDVRIIQINDEPVSAWTADIEAAPGQVGEITVRGPMVTRSYFERPKDDSLSKISDGDTFWHRMGDLGRQDDQGRIWFYGRKSHRVITENGTMFSIPCESIFNNHPRVFRSALVGVGPSGRQRPVICIDLVPGDARTDLDRLTDELLELARSNALTKSVEKVLYPREFPVDIRHNSKIFREKLATWAEKHSA